MLNAPIHSQVVVFCLCCFYLAHYLLSNGCTNLLVISLGEASLGSACSVICVASVAVLCHMPLIFAVQSRICHQHHCNKSACLDTRYLHYAILSRFVTPTHSVSDWRDLFPTWLNFHTGVALAIRLNWRPHKTNRLNFNPNDAALNRYSIHVRLNRNQQSTK